MSIRLALAATAALALAVPGIAHADRYYGPGWHGHRGRVFVPVYAPPAYVVPYAAPVMVAPAYYPAPVYVAPVPAYGASIGVAVPGLSVGINLPLR